MVYHRNDGILTCDGIIERLFGKMASLVRSVKDLIVEDGEVEGKTKADGMGWSKVGLSNLSGRLVGLKRLIGRGPTLISNGKFGEVTVVVTLPVSRVSNVIQSSVCASTLHLMVEYLRLTALSRGDEVLIKDVKDVFANVCKFGLNLLAILLDQRNLALITL